MKLLIVFCYHGLNYVLERDWNLLTKYEVIDSLKGYIYNVTLTNNFTKYL